MDTRLRHYLFIQQPIGAFVVNFALNAAIAWGLFRDATTVPVWGPTSVAGDTIATSFILPFLSVLIATPLVQRDVRHGRASPEDIRDPGPMLRSLPRPILARALVLGLVGLVVAAPLAVLALGLTGVTQVPMTQFVWIKAIYAAALGALLAPGIAMAAIANARTD